MNDNYSEKFEKMRVAGKLASQTLDMLTNNIKEGISTDQIDKLGYEFIRDNGGTPGFKGYHGFPSTLCISKDSEVVHGIPCDKEIEEGAILSIDCGVLMNDFYGDSAYTFAVGEISDDKRRLLNITKEALDIGVEAAIYGNTIGDIGYAIQSYIEKNGYSVVRDFCGHGISNIFHEHPNILHYGKKDTGIELVPGMTFTIEPMINEGKYDIKVLNDGWTAVTKDKSLSAQFEHTIGINENGYEIFTESDKGYRKPPYN